MKNIGVKVQLTPNNLKLQTNTKQKTSNNKHEQPTVIPILMKQRKKKGEGYNWKIYETKTPKSTLLADNT